MNSLKPNSLADLFEVFARLDGGEQIALASPEPPDEAAPIFPAQDERSNRTGAWVAVTSSGSTGRSKLVWRPWAELRSESSGSESVSGWTWASPFAPHTFAGVQVALQAWRSAGRVISLNANPADAWRSLREENVDALCATPTFADLLLQQEAAPLSAWKPRQITLGGEPLRASLGARLAERFPHCRFSVIYATAELGVLLKTNSLDGWYRMNSLGRRYPGWRVMEGVLEVWSRGSWVATGDRVETQGDLIRIVGRADAVANIGGVKVSLAHISELAEQVPGVRRAVAIAETNPITGQIVALKYATDPAFEAYVVKQSLQTYLQANLRKEAWPRRWEIDPLLPVNNAKRIVQ